MATGIKDALYTKGVLKAKRLERPVVSVGSISAGGAGKTPVVIALAKLLREAGWQVDVLTRGYGREGRGLERVSAKVEDAARLFGDEPVLIERETGVPVWVGGDRFAAGVLAEQGCRASAGEKQVLRVAQNDRQKSRSNDNDKSNDKSNGSGNGEKQVLRVAQNDRQKSSDNNKNNGNDNDNDKSKSGDDEEKRSVHLLDDGFQHRKLTRAVDIALVTAEDIDDELLPVGNLREAPGALHRADVIVVRAEERGRMLPRLRSMGLEEKPVWVVTRKLRFPAPLGVLTAGLRPMAFCALARPESFEAMLREAGCGVVDTLAFRDHHAYVLRDMTDIVKTAKKIGATGFVTTEKDAVKLTADMRAVLEPHGPLAVVALEATFADKAGVLQELEARLG